MIFRYIVNVIILLSVTSILALSNDATNIYENHDEINNSTNSTPVSDFSTTAMPGKVTLLRSVDDLRQMSRKRCSRYYTLDCLKVDMISFIDRMGRNTKLNIISGITLSTDHEKYASYQRALGAKNLELFSSESDQTQLDDLLLEKFSNYIRSLSLDIRIFQDTEATGKSINDNLLDTIIRSVDGRADKKTGTIGSKLTGALTSIGLMAGGAFVWLGLSTIAAVATKALITALISLVISCFTAYKTSGSSHGKSTTYEIVAKPLYPHAHTSVAEIQHDPHSAASSLGYGRNMEWDKSSNVQIPIRHATDDMVSASATHDMVYRAHVRPIYKRGIRTLQK